MNSIRNSLFSLLACFSCALGAQTRVYNIGDLLKRIDQPDTVYVVNFWATWCKPCIKELPSFDSLHVNSRGKPVKVILVSLDFKEDIKTRLTPFLKKHAVKAECVLLDESNGNDFINAVSPAWSGAIPATLFKKGGKKTLAERPLTLSEIELLLSEFQ